jgi:hypothetical protein
MSEAVCVSGRIQDQYRVDQTLSTVSAQNLTLEDERATSCQLLSRCSSFIHGTHAICLYHQALLCQLCVTAASVKNLPDQVNGHLNPVLAFCLQIYNLVERGGRPILM